MKVEELVSSIRRNEIVVPEFQREFVWNKARSKELINSLLKEYPVGGILIWKTEKPPHLKGALLKNGHENYRSYQVLLDGQQRATSLFMLTTGEIPPYYKEEEIGDDPRSLAFNLFSGELRYWTKTVMISDESWQLVTECMVGKVDHTELALSIHQRFSDLKKITDHDFDFDITDRSRAFGEIRTLIESAGFELKFMSQQIWNLVLPAKTIKVTIAELYRLHVGFKLEKAEDQWRDEDYKVDQQAFMKFWTEKVAFEAEAVVEKYSDLPQLIRTFTKNFQRLLNIKKQELFRQDIPEQASFSDAIDIFDKINSQGVHLSNAELALTHITAEWPDARRRMKKFLERLSKLNFDLNLAFTTRLLILTACDRASLSMLSASSYEPLRGLSEEELKVAWERSEIVFLYLVDVLRGEKITTSEIIRSKSVLFPMFYYLLQAGGNFTADSDRRMAIYWIHNALIWGRYAGSADQKLEEDINIIRNSRVGDWTGLISRIIDQRGRLKVEPSDLEGSGADGRYFNTFYVMLKHRAAQDWYTGVSLDSPENKNFAINRHHIFPRALLKKHGYSESNKIQNAIVNEIANMAIITDITNIKISDKEPMIYLPSVAENYPTALKSQFVPDDEELWRVESFELFIKTRRVLIADAMNAFLSSYKDDSITHEEKISTATLASGSESEVLEFKETWQYDVYQSQQEEKHIKNKKLQLSSIKTVAAFMNSNGGELLIGVADNNQVEGLDRDLNFADGSMDKLERIISQEFANAIGLDKKPYYKFSFPEIDGRVLCRIAVIKNMHSKAWVTFSGQEYFFIRDGNTTKSLSGEEADQYWSERLNT